MKYKDFETLRKNKDFQDVYNTKKSIANSLFAMYSKKNNLSFNRLGISVSKKVGNSVIRHKIGRIIREIYRLNSDKVCQGFDIVVIARENSNICDSSSFKKALINLLKRSNLLKEKI